jgi:hypothetical protein
VSLARCLYLGTAAVSILGVDRHAPDVSTIQLWNDDRHLQDLP